MHGFAELLCLVLPLLFASDAWQQRGIARRAVLNPICSHRVCDNY